MATQLKEPDPAPEPLIPPANAEEWTGERDWDAEARAHGWRPLEEFKGDPKQFVDAETYAKRADEVLPFVKKENKQLRGEIDFLKRQVKRVMKSEQSAYENALAELERRQDKAVETGDVAGARQLREEAKKLSADMVADTPGGDRLAEATRAFNDWRDKNEWYDLGNLAGSEPDERQKRAYADRMMDANVDLTKTMDPADFFEHITGLVDAKYPAVRAPRPKGQEAVGGVTRSAPRGTPKTGANLPPEAKAQAKRFHDQGVYKGTLAEAYDKYAKSYDWN